MIKWGREWRVYGLAGGTAGGKVLRGVTWTGRHNVIIRRRRRKRRRRRRRRRKRRRRRRKRRKGRRIRGGRRRKRRRWWWWWWCGIINGRSQRHSICYCTENGRMSSIKFPRMCPVVFRWKYAGSKMERWDVMKVRRLKGVVVIRSTQWICDVGSILWSGGCVNLMWNKQEVYKKVLLLGLLNTEDIMFPPSGLTSYWRLGKHSRFTLRMTRKL